MITVLLKTFGRDVEKLGEAIGSFLGQSYEGAMLHVINTHPDELVLDKKYDNVRVYNRFDIFGNEKEDFESLPEKILYSLKTVETPLWCVLDDDDIMCSWHLKQLIDVWGCLSPVDREREMVRIQGEGIFLMRDGVVTNLLKNYAWTRCAFRGWNQEWVESDVKDLKKKKMDCGMDVRIWRQDWYEVDFGGKCWVPSYIYRREDGIGHISPSGYSPDKKVGYRALNQKAHKHALNEIQVVPAMKADYDSVVLEYMREVAR